MLTCHQITNALEWANITSALPPHVLQSWPWGEVKSRWDWTADHWLWREGARPVAAAQILARPIPYTPWSMLYISKGPLWDYRDPALMATILAELERYAKQKRALFIKIDPDLPLGYGEELSPDMAGQIARTLLQQRGWQYSPEQIQFRNTIVINLEPTEAELLAAMKNKWRYNIRLAEKRGVIIRHGKAADLDTFYAMYAETAARDNFLIRPAAYYYDVWRTFMQANQAELWLAEVEGQVIAGVFSFYAGTTAWYLYGASTGQHRDLMPNHLLQWTAMQQAKGRGCTRYDMWGAPDVFNEADSMWGVYRFKQGFGGQVIHGLGAWDYPVYPRLYRAFTQTLPKVRGWVRKIRN